MCKENEPNATAGLKRKAENAPPKSDEESECECNSCGKVSTDSDPDYYSLCALCSEMVCDQCVNKCEKCGEEYCDCVFENSDKEICQDCECGVGFVCCNDDVTMVPCGRKVCGDCAEENHRGFECNQCLQEVKSGRWAADHWIKCFWFLECYKLQRMQSRPY